ncbi:MAG TPA: hypothetical protein VFI29_22405 [Hanamia sp.]|nr:hypothetical protein [Hanamia sp.]
MSKLAIKSISYQNLLNDLALKRDILFFDKLLVDQGTLDASKLIANFYFQTCKNCGPNFEKQKQAFEFNQRNIDFLGNKGLLEITNLTSQLEISVNKDDRNAVIVENLFSKLSNFGQNYNDFLRTKKPELLKVIMDGFIELSDNTTRLYCIKKIIEGNTSNFPILHRIDSLNNVTTVDKNYVVKFILSQIPEPEDDVSWEQLLDFRDDLDTKTKYFTLMDWINQISKTNLEPSEFEEKYNQLFYDYLNQYKIHKIKHKSSIIEVLVNGTVEFIENALTLKFSKITKGFFQVFKANTTLIESEQNIRGRELAYIHKINRTFE